MDQLAVVTGWLALGLLVAATVLYAYQFYLRRTNLAWWARLLAGAGTVVLTASIGFRSSADDGTVLTGPHNTLVLLAWALLFLGEQRFADHAELLAEHVGDLAQRDLHLHRLEDRRHEVVLAPARLAHGVEALEQPRRVHVLAVDERDVLAGEADLDPGAGDGGIGHRRRHLAHGRDRPDEGR